MLITIFILWPIAELFVFILVAKSTSLSTAFLLTLATSFLGSVMLRSRRRLESAGYSARSLENYLFANLGALALILPGFISDFFGLIVLIPPARRAFFSFLKWRKIDLYGNSKGPFSVFKAYRFGSGLRPNDDTIDIEARTTEVETMVDDNAISRVVPDDNDPIDVEFTVRD